MKLDQEIVDGIYLWFRARQIEAIKRNDKEMFQNIQILTEDLAGSVSHQEYPWDTIMRAFMDMQNKKSPPTSPPDLKVVK